MSGRALAEHLRKLAGTIRSVVEAKEGIDGIGMVTFTDDNYLAIVSLMERAADALQPKHQNAEAFSLMLYRCELNAQTSAIRQAVAEAKGEELGPVGCGKEEWLWNSRDGVTPFGIACDCGETMFHVDWSRDTYAPNFKPLKGQRIFANGTREEALYIIGRRWHSMTEEGYELPKAMTFDDYAVRCLEEDFPEGWPTIRTVE